MPFFISLDGRNKLGPLSLLDIEVLIQKGELKESCQVWRTGMERWESASSLPELQILFDQLPPPLEDAPPPLEDETQSPEEASQSFSFEEDSPSAVNRKSPRFKNSFVSKALSFSGVYLSGTEYFGILFIRVFLAFFLAAAAEIVFSENITLSAIAWEVVIPYCAMVLTRVQRAKSLGGNHLFWIILCWDAGLAILSVLLMSVGVENIAPLAPAMQFVSGAYWLWSSISLLFDDSYSPDKGGEAVLMSYLNPKTQKQSNALIELIERRHSLAASCGVPSDVVVVPSRLAPGKQSERGEQIGRNEFYELVAMGKRGRSIFGRTVVIPIADWTLQSPKILDACYRKRGHHKNVDETLAAAVDTVSTM